MATGGVDDVGDLAGGHEEVYEWTCGQCEDSGKMTEATAYCRDCDEGYCDTCLKIHRRFPAMKNHKVLDDSQKDNWGKDCGSGGSGKACPDHDGQTISMYCGDHDVVCCPVCVACDHKLCGDLASIPKISKGIAKNPEFQKTQDDLNRTIADTDTVLDKVELGREKLDESRRSAVEAVRDTKKQIVEMFDRLEEVAVSEVGERHKTIASYLEANINNGNDVRKRLQSISQILKPSAKVCESGLFIDMKICQRNVAECKEIIRSMLESSKKCEVTFTAGPSLQEVYTVTSLGEVGIRDEYQLYKLRKEYECIVETSKDKFESAICGMYMLPTGEMLLSDQANRTIKRFDISYKMIDSCSLPGKPSQICGTHKTDPAEVVVALLNGSLQFLSIDGGMKVTISMKMKHKCNGLAYHLGRFYISNASERVYIYTYAGNLIRTVELDDDGRNLFSDSQDITLKASADGGVVYIADYIRGIITLDLDGNYASTIKHPKVGSCSKAFSDEHGNILTLSRHVTQIGNNGDTVLKILENEVQDFFLDTRESVLYVLSRGKTLDPKFYMRVYQP